MTADTPETPLELVRRLTRGEFDSLRDSFNAGRADIALKGLDERGAASEIVRDQYTGRYPLELLQNANDAASAARAAGGCVKFVLTDTALLVADQGAGFGVDQVRAICGLARSSKDPRKSVGYKGLGFKSVREITDIPQVVSGDLMFCFDAARLRREVESIVGVGLTRSLRLPEYAFPFEIRLEELEGDLAVVRALVSDGFKTVVRLPLRTSDDRLFVEERLIDVVVPRLLLFLDATESIELAGTRADFTALAVRKQNDTHQELLLEVGDVVEHFLVFRREVPIDDPTLVSALGRAWSEVESVRLAAAVPLGEDEMPVGGASEPLHVYFPTEEHSGISLIMNGDFQMELDRRRISRTPQAEPYNVWLRDNLADFVAHSVVPTLARRYYGIGVLDVLAPYSEQSGWGAELMQEIFNQLASEEFVPCSDSELRRPADCLLLPSSVPDPFALGRWLKNPSAFVLPTAEAIVAVRKLLLENLDVSEVELGPLLADLKPSAETDPNIFYKFILDWSSRTSRGFEVLLSKSRCVRLSSGKWVVPGEELVFLPPQRGEANFPTDLEVPVAQIPEIEGLIKLLEGAGVKPLTWRQLIFSVVMPLLIDSDARRSERDSALLTLKTYVRQVRRNESTSPDIREAVAATLLPARDVSGGSRRYRRAGELYFSQPWAGAELLEVIYGDFGQADFLDVEPTEDQSLDFEFYKWLGVSEVPRVVQIRLWDPEYSSWRQSDENKRAAECPAGPGMHPASQRLTSSPSIDRLAELLHRAEPSQLTALGRVLSARWGYYRQIASTAVWRCVASAGHKVPRDRAVTSPALFMLRNAAWVPSTKHRTPALEMPGSLWRSTQGLPRSVVDQLAVPSTDLGRISAGFAEDLGFQDIATVGSTYLLGLLCEIEAANASNPTPEALQSAEWILRRLEDSEWESPISQGSVPMLARVEGRLTLHRHPVIARDPSLAEAWGDTLAIYAGDHNLPRLLDAAGVKTLDAQVKVEPIAGRRQPRLEAEVGERLRAVAPALIALATRDIPSRRQQVAELLHSLRPVCSAVLALRYSLEGHPPRVIQSTDAYIDRDGVSYIQTDGVAPDWSSLALRLADYLGTESGDGFALILAADERTRETFLRAHRLSADALDQAASAFEGPASSQELNVLDDAVIVDAVLQEPEVIVEASTTTGDGFSSVAGSPAHDVSRDNAESIRRSSVAPDTSGTSVGASENSGSRPSSLRGEISASAKPPSPEHDPRPSTRSAATAVPEKNTADAQDAEVGSRFYSYVVAHGTREARMAGRAESDAMRIGSLGVERVIAYEAECGRTATSQNHSNRGFDVLSARSDNSERRIIEVKATAGAWPARGIPVSRHQIQMNIESRDEFWIYVVEFAADPARSTVVPLKNPIAAVDYYVFDAGWRNLAT